MKVVKMNLYSVLSMLVILMLTSCDEESEFEKQVKEDERLIENYLNRNNVNAEKDASGIFYEVLERNESGETINNGNAVSFYYKLTTLDSTYSEVMSDSANAVIMEQNYNSIVPSGIYHGLDMMRKGEKYRLYIPSYLAYGTYSNTDFFGPQANFIIDLEVRDVQTKDEVFDQEISTIDQFIANDTIEDVSEFSSGLYYKTLEAGTGKQPSANSLVRIHFTRKYLDGTVIYETPQNKPVETYLNNQNLVEGLVEGISKMKFGEKAMFIMPSKLAFGGSVQVLPRSIREDLIEENILINASVLPFTPVIYEVELLSNQ